MLVLDFFATTNVGTAWFRKRTRTLHRHVAPKANIDPLFFAARIV